MLPRYLFVLLSLTAFQLGCAASAVQPLQATEGRSSGIAVKELTASDYSASLDLLALGYRDGTIEVRTPAPHHLLMRGKHQSAIANLALSPDHTRLASLDRLGTLAVSVLETGELQVLSDDGPQRAADGAMMGLSWDGSGRRIATALSGRVRVVDLADESRLEVELEQPVAALTFTPDGKQLVVAGSRLEVLSLPGLKRVRSIEIPRGPRAVRVTDVRYSPDGGVLGVLMLGGAAFVDVASDQLEVEHFSSFDPVGLRFGPDGRVLLFGRKALYVGPPSVKGVEAAAHQLNGGLAGVEFRKDGSLLFVGDAQDAELAALLD